MIVSVARGIFAALLLSAVAHGQAGNASNPTPTPSALTPNATLVLPAVAGVDLSSGEVIQASVVTVQGQTTIFQLVDSVPDPTQTTVRDAVTATIALSPTQYQTNLTAVGNGLISATETCTFAEDGTGNATCVAVAVTAQNGTTSTSSQTSTLPFASVPVVAANFGQASTATSPSSSSATTTPTGSPKSAAPRQYQFSVIVLPIAAAAIGFSQITFY